MTSAWRSRSQQVTANRSHWINILICLGVLALAALMGGLASQWMLGGLLAVLLLVFLIAKDETGLALVVVVAFLVPFEMSVSSAVSINGVIILLPLLFVLWIFKQIRTRARDLHWSRTYAPLGALLLVALLAWLSGNADWNDLFPKPANLIWVQLGQWGIYALSVMAYLLAAHQTVKSLKWLTAVFLALGVVALVGRYGGPLGDLINPWLKPYAVSNASFFVWMTALAAGQALFNQHLARSWRLGLLILAFAVPLLGVWQNLEWVSSWLPALIALFIVLWLRSRFVSVSFVLVLLMLLLLFSGIFLQAGNWQNESEVSAGGRFVLWESVLQLAMQRPILGLGLTTYRQYYQFIPLLTEHGRWWQPSVNSHNLYIDLFAQMGIVGLAVFGWVVYEIGRLQWRLRRRFTGGFESGYVASATAGLVAMLFASALVEYLLPFVYNVGFNGFRFSVMSWLFLGGLVALEHSLRNRQTDLPAAG